MNDETMNPAPEDQTTPDPDEVTLRPEDEFRLLKDRAKTLGILISGNIGVDTLKKKIEATPL